MERQTLSHTIVNCLQDAPAPIVEEILCMLSTTFNRTYGTLHEMKLIPDIAKVAKIMRQNNPRHRGKNLVILFG